MKQQAATDSVVLLNYSLILLLLVLKELTTKLTITSSSEIQSAQAIRRSSCSTVGSGSGCSSCLTNVLSSNAPAQTVAIFKFCPFISIQRILLEQGHFYDYDDSVIRRIIVVLLLIALNVDHNKYNIKENSESIKAAN
jgi:hypothetical protein